jgi:putative ABC transport system ATP-binding protein
MGMKAILEVEQLRKSYRSGEGELTVLKDVSFSLKEGDSLAIVGPSGSGKTTLLGLCAGLDTPTNGKVCVAGRNIGELNEDGRAALRNEVVGFVFQNFQLLPTLTAIENIMVPMELRGGKGALDRAKDLLKQVGLADRATHYPAQLSGGEQQRVALARAFINEPRLLFADEPTGNLDAENSEHVVELLFGLNKAAGTALVLVTHNPELAHLTHRMIRLKGGAVVEDTTQ